MKTQLGFDTFREEFDGWLLDPASGADEAVCWKEAAVGKMHHPTREMRDIANVYLDLSVTNQCKEFRIVIVNTQTTRNPEGMVPRFQLLGFRMLIIAHELDNIVPKHEPESRYELPAELGTVEEALDPTVSVCVAPDRWGKPGQEAG